MASTPQPPEIDKQALYGNWLRRDEQRARFAHRLKHMALDLPEAEDVDVRVHKGISWKEILAIGALATGLIWGYGQLPHRQPAPQPDQPTHAATSPVDSEYEIRFYDKDGNLIEVPRKE